jgi:hypothetical protein
MEAIMSDAANEHGINFTVDKSNLYREESITDFKVASIRRLIPIRTDGTDDPGRKPIFVGQTQLMSPEGPVPIQSELKAGTLAEALDEFPKAMERALAEVIERLKKAQQQRQQQQRQRSETSRIIIPGR